MSRSASGAVVRRCLNRVPSAPPVLSRSSAALIGWRGPVATDDDVPPPEAFPRLTLDTPALPNGSLARLPGRKGTHDMSDNRIRRLRKSGSRNGDGNSRTPMAPLRRPVRVARRRYGNSKSRSLKLASAAPWPPSRPVVLDPLAQARQNVLARDFPEVAPIPEFLIEHHSARLSAIGEMPANGRAAWHKRRQMSFIVTPRRMTAATVVIAPNLVARCPAETSSML